MPFWKPSVVGKGKTFSFIFWDVQSPPPPTPIECLHPNTCFFRVTYVSMKWHVHSGYVTAGQSYEVTAHLSCKLHPCKWFLLDFSAQAAESSSHYPRDLKTSAPHKLLTVSPTNHHPESHQRELASLHRREERNRYPPLPLSWVKMQIMPHGAKLFWDIS